MSENARASFYLQTESYTIGMILLKRLKKAEDFALILTSLHADFIIQLQNLGWR
ncbi:hypothetical protein KIN20_033152 [Parelaphostrongylus tenuis]|uniref:Uncharacterized protein n=1 Tax=Parelaphostrongylus tenuis TaxID=148309 RepID=A0AAD5WIM6_PARTN|nr:hypothetical protein KIN20_033152 [Parelaphostrongylus tenuis]